MGMLFRWIVSGGDQQAAGHTQVENDMVAALERHAQKLAPAGHAGNGLPGGDLAKVLCCGVGDNFGAVDRHRRDGQALYLWLQHPTNCLYLRKFRHGAFPPFGRTS